MFAYHNIYASFRDAMLNKFAFQYSDTLIILDFNQPNMISPHSLALTTQPIARYSDRKPVSRAQIKHIPNNVRLHHTVQYHFTIRDTAKISWIWTANKTISKYKHAKSRLHIVWQNTEFRRKFPNENRKEMSIISIIYISLDRLNESWFSVWQFAFQLSSLRRQLYNV